MASGKQIGILSAVAVACVGAAYGIGRYQTASRIDDAEQRASAAASASAAAVGSAQVGLEIERAKVARLEGRRRLHLAIVALDDKNFGTAQDHLAAARAHLAAAKGNDPELAKLAAEIDALKLVATEDSGDQRKKILDLCKRLDELVPPAPTPK